MPDRWFPGNSSNFIGDEEEDYFGLVDISQACISRNCLPACSPTVFTAALCCLESESMDLRKVYGGTPIGNDSRCDTCTHARIIQGYAESEKIVLCTSLYDPIRIPFKVSQCSDYDDKRLPSVQRMEDIAWFLRTKSAGNAAGFVCAADVKSDNEENDGNTEPTGTGAPVLQPED